MKAILCTIALVAFLHGTIAPSQAEDPLKVGFIYNSPVGSAGWTFAHNAGRLEMEAALGAKVSTTYIESATEADVERILRELVSNGHKLIFTTSFGFMNPTVKVAGTAPGTMFQHATGYKLAKNVGVYHARAYEARYLSGVLAGRMSKSGVAGFVASFPIPEVIRGINAFTLGMRSVNPQARVKVVWISSWYDPGKERDAADAMISQGADVISQFTDSGGPIQAADAKGVWAIGVGSAMSSYGAKAHLTSVGYKWGGFYTDMAKAVMAGTWASENVWGGLKRDMIDLTAMNAAVPQDVKDLVAARRAAIAAGEMHPFQGPIKDQSGAVKVAAGETMDDGALLGFKWYVEGVEGALPE
ncbi:MAG: BMP family ABC transporter substrate-binding protein [Hyphomicrobiales bacterium]